MYIELLTASAFSFLRGATLPELLVDRAAALGYPALALVDRDGVYGIPRFHEAAQAAGIKPLVGAELSIAGTALPHQAPAFAAGAATAGRPGTVWPLPVLVASRAGYQNLCRLLTRMKLNAPKGEGALTLDELDGHVAGLIALPGRPLLDARHGVGGLLDRLIGIFGRANVFVAIERHCLRDEEAEGLAPGGTLRLRWAPTAARLLKGEET